MDCYKLSCNPSYNTLSDVISLQEYISISYDTWFATVDLANAFFSIPIRRRVKHFLLCMKNSNMYSPLTSGPCSLSFRNLDQLTFDRITQWHGEGHYMFSEYRYGKCKLYRVIKYL